ncbi:MAG: hypothetical protein KBB51_01615 [Candidatus Moranbacteria bacterium]|jgi:hypothetical protein|nr:hypothetical protein [Candidatus Moranbacteria bacterium]
MNGFFKKKYGLILFIGIFIAIGLTYWFGIRRMMDVIRSDRDDIQRMLAIRENRNHQLSRLEEYDSQYERIVSDEKWLDTFTNRDDMIEFIRRLEFLAEEGGVTVILEAREAPKPSKKPKATVAKPVKSDGKEEEGSDAAEGSSDKKEKKELSIIEGLPSTSYTYLGLHVTGETEKIVKYLHKVETLPIVLDIISIEALRKENPDFSQERESEQPVPVAENSVSMVSTNELIPQDPKDDSSAVPEEIVSEMPEMKAFEVEVTADLVVYHPKE